jgi:hypothetical protein
MEIVLLAIAVVVIGAFIYYNRSSKGLDVNNDGKVDSADVKAAVQNVVCGAKETADVNKDGKVDAADVKVVTEKVKTVAKKTTAKAKETVKKVAPTRGRKPQAK